ncbi:MAG: hypothetical protein KDK99_03805 [Verrucomicrobiales bacterium]|nr:hypothetical protein [Verrucomicrobiales bacterium]
MFKLSVGAVFLLSLSACEDRAQIDALNNQVRVLESAQNKAKEDLARVQLQMRTLQKERETIKEEKEKLQQQLDEAKQNLDDVKGEFQTYKQQYKLSIRERAPGMSLGNLEIAGREYRNVKIRELSEVQIAVMHDAGTASFAVADLPENIQGMLAIEKVPTATEASQGIRKNGVDSRLDYDREMTRLTIAMESVQGDINSMRQQMTEHIRASTDANASSEQKLVHQKALAALQVKLNLKEVDLQQLQKQQVSLNRSR